MRLPALLLVLILPGACVDLQGSYTAEARKQCRDIINADERRNACAVAENDTRAGRNAGTSNDRFRGGAQAGHHGR